jgi:site-specific recombinase XerD
MTNASFKIILRKDRPKNNGEFPICLRVTIGRKSKLYPILNYTCLEINFISDKKEVKKSDPLHRLKNKLINNWFYKALTIQNDYANEDKNLSLAEFDRVFRNDNYGSKSFYDYIEYLIVKRENELASETLESYRKGLSNLRKFRPNLTFSEVNDDFISAYRTYLIKDLKNKEITWNKRLEFIKRICNIAYKEKKIKENPVRNLEIKRLKGDTLHLSLDELKQLHVAYQSGSLAKGQMNVLRYFLFACYTGMRYRDVYDLRFTSLKIVNEAVYLDFKQHKTNKLSFIPVIDQAKELIPLIHFDQQKVFMVFANQYTNKVLKKIMSEVKISKRITFHSARHTCSNALFELGIDSEVRCQIIGDTPEVISKHYTSENLNMKLAALTKYSQAMKDTELQNPEKAENNTITKIEAS